MCFNSKIIEKDSFSVSIKHILRYGLTRLTIELSVLETICTENRHRFVKTATLLVITLESPLLGQEGISFLA